MSRHLTLKFKFKVKSYDNDTLVDDNHPYPKCKETPDQYGKDRWFMHIFWDDGGIAWAGAPAFLDSCRWKNDHNPPANFPLSP